MKKLILFVILITFYAQSGRTQNKETLAQRTITVNNSGTRVEFQPATGTPAIRLPGPAFSPLSGICNSAFNTG